jgi:hypothetical protein
MLGTGNVGKELLSGRDEARTYLSRDAGVTWQEVSAGRRIPEYGDHGGVIVLVDPTGSERSTIEYTLDEGETWQKYEVQNFQNRSHDRANAFLFQVHFLVREKHCPSQYPHFT